MMPLNEYVISKPKGSFLTQEPRAGCDQAQGFACFPSTIEYGHIDLGVVDVFTGFPYIPKQHVPRRPDRAAPCRKWEGAPLCFPNELLEMFRHAPHVKGDYDSSA